MFKTHVNELAPGDDIYVENHWGEFELRTVGTVNKFYVLTPKQRFMKSSGWEIFYKYSRKELLKGRHRYRIHFGNGLLFTPEQVKAYQLAQVEETKQTELIYQAIRTSPVLWRNLSIKQLIQVNEWLKGHTSNDKP